jgi:hypothetical protein
MRPSAVDAQAERETDITDAAWKEARKGAMVNPTARRLRRSSDRMAEASERAGMEGTPESD